MLYHSLNSIKAKFKKLEEQMKVAQSVVEDAHRIRKTHSIKLRQPLGKIVGFVPTELADDVWQVILSETNIKTYEQKIDKEKIVVSLRL